MRDVCVCVCVCVCVEAGVLLEGELCKLWAVQLLALDEWCHETAGLSLCG